MHATVAAWIVVAIHLVVPQSAVPPSGSGWALVDDAGAPTAGAIVLEHDGVTVRARTTAHAQLRRGGWPTTGILRVAASFIPQGTNQTYGLTLGGGGTSAPVLFQVQSGGTCSIERHGASPATLSSPQPCATNRPNGDHLEVRIGGNIATFRVNGAIAGRVELSPTDRDGLPGIHLGPGEILVSAVQVQASRGGLQ